MEAQARQDAIISSRDNALAQAAQATHYRAPALIVVGAITIDWDPFLQAQQYAASRAHEVDTLLADVEMRSREISRLRKEVLFYDLLCAAVVLTVAFGKVALTLRDCRNCLASRVQLDTVMGACRDLSVLG